MEQQRFLTRYISVLYRQGNRYYDKALARFGIGCGQQFFLMRISENEGISMYDLAHLGHFDKGTVTKAVQKLEEQGYLRIAVDPEDRRIRRLYTTEPAKEVIEGIHTSREDWHDILTAGMSAEDAEQAQLLLAKMAENAYHYMKQTNHAEHSLRGTSKNQTKEFDA